jgi:hypothetical protein
MPIMNAFTTDRATKLSSSRPGVRVPVARRDPRCAVQLAERVVELRDDRPEIVRYGGGGIRNCGLILRLLRFRERFGQQSRCLPVDDRGIGRSCGRRLFGGQGGHGGPHEPRLQEPMPENAGEPGRKLTAFVEPRH